MLALASEVSGCVRNDFVKVLIVSATPLGEILRENGIISPIQLSEALQIQKEERGRIGDVLVTLS